MNDFSSGMDDFPKRKHNRKPLVYCTMMKYILMISLLILSCCDDINESGEMTVHDITVLEEPADFMMQNYLTRMVDRQFAIRDSVLSTLLTIEDWSRHSEYIREAMVSWAGPFPEKTPLNSRVTGRLEREEYVVEKLLFESRPGIFVSANLYLPKNVSFPRPAILNVIGHAAMGKADERYQKLGISQAKKGFIALVMDGLGQGERKIHEYSSQGWGNPPGDSHMILGTQAFISGTHVFNFMIWDVIRAVDYLAGRPDVDVSRIGITGSSGGGMLSTYVLPFEDRISVVVPVCNPNTWSHRVHADLATDHEQVFIGAFEHAIDPRGDPLFTHVPKPLLINATTDDHLNPPRGVWELNNWLFKAYSAHGAPEKLSTSMVRAGHEYNQEQREITLSWMLRWTGGDAADFWEEEAAVEEEKNLWASGTGSVYHEPGARTPRDWLLEYTHQHMPQWDPVTTNYALTNHQEVLFEGVKEVLRVNLEPVEVTGVPGEIRQKADIFVRPYTIIPEEGVVLPAVLFTSKKEIPNGDIILYVNDEGKSQILHDFEIVQEMLHKGYAVFAVDLRGSGETAPDKSDKFWDLLAGQPIFGQRVYDVLATLKWLQESEIQAQHIKYWGKNMGALYGAFAGVLSEDMSGLFLEEPLLSFASVVEVVVPQYRNEIIVPDILRSFDMAQIYQALSPRPVYVLNPLLGDKTGAVSSDIEKVYGPVTLTYDSVQKDSAWFAGVAGIDERNKLLQKMLRH